ncbi:succinylglutamate desuccinylase/aspartoacylase family protein [Rhizobium sp. TRM95111]|uniref:succinylglutamate desuccinylase/aspartoacylase domain-containing protein n=1 Tax=Rhizobium alarense TaxID=2846851 RepID=UPI001F2CAE57|nr:succinylglutamate desuccinylase/aspartoacylase family protein [Rhizobium alarense]MCF3641142.1 succinylglutamate desuccinylase/aspartoacylase family protein [Rhizobium alarense]
MDVTEIVLAGDTPGIEWRLPVHRFTGTSPGAPSAYLQAALHASELPGTAVLHMLLQKLRAAEDAGGILGDVTVVPQANPIGAAQWHFGEMQGRFDLRSRTNFNRDFPLIALADRNGLLDGAERRDAVDCLKRRLLHMALGADLVLDLHCDDESLNYAYIDEAFWPEAADLAAAMAMDAVLLSDGESTAFEEAVGFAFKTRSAGTAAAVPGKLSVTLELRGTRDVSAGLARDDADGLMRFLAMRGVLRGAPSSAAFSGPAMPLDHVDMIRALEPGVVLFHRTVGDRVAEGDLLATIVTRPGFAEGDLEIRAARAGLVVTRSSDRFVRRGGDLMKIACNERATTQRKPGTLED